MEEEKEVEENEQSDLVKPYEITHPYKIMAGDIVTIRSKTIESKGKQYTFYHVEVPAKTQNNTKIYYKKEVSFKKDVSLEDRTRIKINSLFEAARYNPIDKFNPIWKIVITDYEVIEEPNYYELQQKEIEDYQPSTEEETWLY